MLVGGHVADDAGRRLELVEFLAGLGVDGLEVAFERSVEHHAAARGWTNDVGAAALRASYSSPKPTRVAANMSQAAVMPPAQTGQSKTAYLAFGLRASEFVDRRPCLFGRLEHGPEPARHLCK